MVSDQCCKYIYVMPHGKAFCFCFWADIVVLPETCLCSLVPVLVADRHIHSQQLLHRCWIGEQAMHRQARSVQIKVASLQCRQRTSRTEKITQSGCSS